MRGVAPVLCAGHRVRERRSLSLVVLTVFLITTNATNALRRLRARRRRPPREARRRETRKYARTVRVAKVTFRGYVWDTVFFSRDATRTSSVRRNDTPCGTHFCYRTRRVFSFFSHSKSWKAFRDALRGTRVDSRVSYGVSRTSRRRRAPRASRRPRPRFVSV